MMDASGISWGVAEKPLQVESGDRYVVAPYADGVLVGVVDGMGHGAPAAEAALRATTLLTASVELFAAPGACISLSAFLVLVLRDRNYAGREVQVPDSFADLVEVDAR